MALRYPKKKRQTVRTVTDRVTTIRAGLTKESRSAVTRAYAGQGNSRKGKTRKRGLMAATDDSENPLDHLIERINPSDWRVISKPTRQPAPEADHLKTLIRTMQEGRRSPRKRKAEETEPPEAA
jgi:hypothetical protein